MDFDGTVNSVSLCIHDVLKFAALSACLLVSSFTSTFVTNKRIHILISDMH